MNPWVASILTVGSIYYMLKWYRQLRARLPPGELRVKLAVFGLIYVWAIGMFIALQSHQFCNLCQ